MAVIWCFPAMKMNLRQWSSCKEMVFVCVIWSFDDMDVGDSYLSIKNRGNKYVMRILKNEYDKWISIYRG